MVKKEYKPIPSMPITTKDKKEFPKLNTRGPYLTQKCQMSKLKVQTKSKVQMTRFIKIEVFIFTHF
jgi:hypothetical protein